MAKKEVIIGIEVEMAATKNGVPFVLTKEHIPHGKDTPLWVEDAAGKKIGNVQLDCVLAEVALEPATSAEVAWMMYDKLRKTAESLLPEGVDLTLATGQEYNYDDLMASEEANEIGCSASYNAYEGIEAKNATPSFYQDEWRYAGIHLNIDFEGTHEQKLKFIKALDTYVGLYSVHNWEAADREVTVQRRKLYGGAGNHRITDFGVEYRVLPSSVWSFNNLKKMFELVKRALDNPTAGNDRLEGYINAGGVL